MLKRVLLTVALAASTLLVTGATAAGHSTCTPAGHATGATTAKQECRWRGDCYYCYSYRTGSWDLQRCDGGGDSEDGGR